MNSYLETEYSEKTQTLVASERRVVQDVQTGEVFEIDQVVKRVYGTKQFWKVYLMDFLATLGIIDSKQLDVFIFIAENTNPSNNLFIGTYKHIAETINVSQPTIARIMKKLQEKNAIKKVQNGVWLINPALLLKGSDRKKQLLLTYYNVPEPLKNITTTHLLEKGDDVK